MEFSEVVSRHQAADVPCPRNAGLGHASPDRKAKARDLGPNTRWDEGGGASRKWYNSIIVW